MSSRLTNSALCTFDIDAQQAGGQFRLVYVPATNPSFWRLNASNPGQFYYNVFPAPGATTLIITVPFPFITRGVQPIHFYDGVTTGSSATQTCFVPGTALGADSTKITLANYGALAFGNTSTLTLTLPPGTRYVNIRLDYRLEGETRCTKTGKNASCVKPLAIAIPNLQMYGFADSSGSSVTVQSENSFNATSASLDSGSYGVAGTLDSQLEAASIIHAPAGPNPFMALLQSMWTALIEPRGAPTISFLRDGT